MAIGDFFTQTMDGGDPVVATVSTNRSGGGTSLSCDDLDNWPQDTVHYITYKKKASGAIDYDTLQTFKGIVSGNTIGTVTLKSSPTGSDLGNDIGDYVRLAPTASYAQDLYDGLAVSHDVDGTLKANTVDTTQLVDDAVTTAKIDDGAITTAKIADGAVTPDKLGTGAAYAYEDAQGTTSSTSYTATLGGSPGTNPSVTVDIGANGLALVTVSAQCANSTTGAASRASFAVSGASTQAADNRRAVGTAGSANDASIGSSTTLVTGLTAGSNTFTMQYMVSGGTGAFLNRSISVVPL